MSLLSRMMTTIICACAVLLLSVFIGSADIPFTDFLRALWIPAASRTIDQDLALTIYGSIRLPRIFLAAVCGAALGGAGVISQGLFRNSLASPSIVGTTMGASLSAVLVYYFIGPWSHWLTLPLAAFAGAMLATLTVFGLAQRFRNMTIGHLLLVGFAMNTLFGAATSLVISFMLEDHERTSAAMHWLLGGFVARGWDDLALASAPLLLGAGLALRVCRYLDILSLGEETATALAVPVARVRLLGIASMALLVGGVVSVAGGIGFVGLVVPHITRLIIGPNHKRLFWVSMINGITLMVFADLLARTLRSPMEIEVGVLTALIGAPFFVVLLLRKNGEASL